MIRDQPQGADLLAEARHLLRESLLPDLTPENRYKVLMALRAMDLAERELRADPELENKLNQRLSQLVITGNTDQERFSMLTQSIRDGVFDASVEVHVFLLLVTAFKLKVTDPSKVSEELKGMLDQISMGTPAER